MNNKIAIGCLVQWYEVEMVEDYLISLRNAVRRVSPRRNVQIDICLNLNEGLEKLDTSKKSMYEIERKFLDMVQEILSGCHYVYWKTEIDIYTIADYRRDFNRSYCKSADVLMWGESDSLIPEQTFEVLDMLHSNVETPKYVATFGINKMWDDSWKPLEHPDFTDKPFIEGDTENWWSIPYTMNLKEMNLINEKVEDLDVRQITPHKFNGCGLVISSEVIRSGINIPKSCFFINEDTAFMLMMNKVLPNVPQYHFKNILIVHNRKHPQKRNYILGEDNDIYIDKNRTNHDWYNVANEFCKINNANLFENKKSYTWEDVWERIK
jgi:hypothetical protein